MGFLFKNRIWFRLLRRKFRGFESNYAYNSELEANFDGLITGQRRCPKFKVGFAEFGNVGCEIAAVYNAMKLLDYKITVSDLIREFERKGYIMRGKRTGDFGTDAYAIGDFFKKINLEYFRSRDFDYFAGRNESDIYIVSFWNTDSVWDGYHTVAYYKIPGNAHYSFLNLSGSSAGIVARRSISLITTKKRFIVGYEIFTKSGQ